MVIYCTTNLINGKKYIGSDTNNNPYYLGSGVSIIKAIKKYGRNNFKKEIIAEVTSYPLLRELEEYYIDYYNAANSSLFYNRSDKGVGQGKGKNHWNYGNKLSEETKSKKSKSMLALKITHSKEQRDKWSKDRKGKPSPMKGKKNPQAGRKANYILEQYSLEGNLLNTFNNPEEAQVLTGVNKRGILNVLSLTHYAKTAGGFIWVKKII